jgi:hypothetical protein
MPPQRRQDDAELVRDRDDRDPPKSPLRRGTFFHVPPFEGGLGGIPTLAKHQLSRD